MAATDIRTKAAAMYTGNYNCAQAVLAAFCPATGMEEEEALKLAASFGGGMGSLGEVCGALTGAFMVAGLMRGYTEPSAENKKAHNALIQEMAAKFREKFDSLLCRDLLWRNVDEGAKKAGAKPCLRYVEAAVDIMNEVIQTQIGGR